MDDLLFCPKCGRQRGEDEQFCPKCGRAFGAEAPSLTPERKATDGGATRRVLGLAALAIVLLLALGLVLQGPGLAAISQLVATPTPTPIPRVPCEDAKELTRANHSFLFSLMATTLKPLTFSCRDADEPGATAVVVSWRWNNKDRYGTYIVTQGRQVIAADENARLIDEIAGYGQLAGPTLIRYLIGGM